jgi:hypothetical protein
MNVLVVAASAEVLWLIGTLGASVQGGTAGLRVLPGRLSGRSWRRPDWVLVATADQRRLALDRFQLPTYRVIEMPALASIGALEAERAEIGVALRRMAEIGAHRRLASRFSLGLAALLVRWWAARAERRAALPEMVESGTHRRFASRFRLGLAAALVRWWTARAARRATRRRLSRAAAEAARKAKVKAEARVSPAKVAARKAARIEKRGAKGEARARAREATGAAGQIQKE